MLTAIGQEPVLAFLTGAMLAWGFHSTLAVILLIASFVANGSLELGGALSFILGLNLGGGLPAVSSTLALPPAGRRLPVANLMCRGIAAYWLWHSSAHLPVVAAFLPFDAVNVALAFHAAFNLGDRPVLPALHQTGRETGQSSLCRMRSSMRTSLRRHAISMSNHWTRQSMALSNALLETVRMSEVLNRMFETALSALRTEEHGNPQAAQGAG